MCKDDSNIRQSQKRPDAPRITIIVATFNRADALARTIRCAIAQSFTNWVMLVIGDRCTDHTDRMIAAFNDKRIRFVNLPERFGEQAGPNSVGILLAETEFVAFLNHDDLWLPDHLTSAIRHLEAQKTDLYWSRAAFFRNRGPRSDLPMFVESSPLNRQLSETYDTPFYFTEPMSTWVAYTASLKSLGVMSLSSETPFTPLQDYAIRAWKLGLQLSTGREITVLKDGMSHVRLPHEHKAASYSLENGYAEKLVRMIEQGTTAILHKRIESDLWLSEHLQLARSFSPVQPETSSLPSEVYMNTDLDLMRLKAGAESKGFMGKIGKLLEHRTGEKLTQQPDIGSMVGVAREKLYK